jgi:hypothetical protein
VKVIVFFYLAALFNLNSFSDMLNSTLGGRLSMTVLLFSMFAFAGCLGPRKIDKWVARHYSDEPIEAPRHKPEQIAFVSKLPETGPAPSLTEKQRSHMLPLLFYWQYDYTWSCTLNPDLPVNNFMNAVANNAGHGLKQKLNGNHLELTIQQLPHGFTMEDKGWLVYAILFDFGKEVISVEPQPTDMVVSYRLLNSNNEELKTGTVTVVDPNKTKRLKWFHSLKKTTWQYLEQYDANIVSMSKELVAKLTAEL